MAQAVHVYGAPDKTHSEDSSAEFQEVTIFIETQDEGWNQKPTKLKEI